MALINMRKFAKVNGISYYNAKKYVEDGIIHQDENGMIESGESVRILRHELRDGLKHYTVYLTLENQPVIDSIRDMMDKEGAVEVNSFDDVCVKYNGALQMQVVGVAEDVSRKHKGNVLNEFIRRYNSYVKNQTLALCEKDVLPFRDAYNLVAFGMFPEGYGQLKEADLNTYVKQGIERTLIKCNKAVEDKFVKICRSVGLYWESVDDNVVFTRADITEDFLKEPKRSQLYRNIISDPRSFVIDSSNPLFEELASSSKSAFKPKVLAEFAAKRFYHIVILHDDMIYEEQVRLVHELMLSNCSECIVCGTKDLFSGHIPAGVMLYLDTMQYDWKNRVVYVGDMRVSKQVSGVETVASESVESVAETQEIDSVIETGWSEEMEADNSI